jgi:hypothetical protein
LNLGLQRRINSSMPHTRVLFPRQTEFLSRAEAVAVELCSRAVTGPVVRAFFVLLETPYGSELIVTPLVYPSSTFLSLRDRYIARRGSTETPAHLVEDAEELVRGTYSLSFNDPEGVIEHLLMELREQAPEMMSVAVAVSITEQDYYDPEAPPNETVWEGALVLQIIKSPDTDADTLCGSMLRAAAQESRRVLRRYNYSSGAVDWNLINELARGAGRNVVALIFRLDSAAGYYDAWNAIATLRYEGAPVHGTIAFPLNEVPQLSLTFGRRIPLSDYKATRKVLELCKPDLALIAAEGEILGVSEAASLGTSYCAITFIEDGTWEFVSKGKRLMRVRHGDPIVPRPKVDFAAFETAFNTLFASAERNSAAVWQIIEAVTKQEHGTVVIVTGDAAGEAVRLGGAGIPIQPTSLSSALVSSVSSIDGALIVDPRGMCHSIGVILDGSVSSRGTPRRGARFNSALRYVDTCKDALALVVSEDGDVELIEPRQ